MKLGILLSIVFLWNCSPNDNANEFAGESQTEATKLVAGQAQSSTSNPISDDSTAAPDVEINKDNQLFSSDELQADQVVSKFNSGNLNTEECSFTVVGAALRISDKSQFKLSGSLSTMGWGTNGSQNSTTSTTQTGSNSNPLVNKCISGEALKSGSRNESYLMCAITSSGESSCEGYAQAMNKPNDNFMLGNSGTNYGQCLRNALSRGKKCFRVSEIR